MPELLSALAKQHRAIGRVLQAMEAAALQLRRGVAVDVPWLAEVAHFFVLHVDGTHHAIEEGVLFKALLAHARPTAKSAVAVMLEEHDVAREQTRRLAALARAVAGGDRAAAAGWADAALAICGATRAHVQMEDRVLYPMARAAIPAPELASLHEQLALLPRLEGPSLLEAAQALTERARAWWPDDVAPPRPG